jgi:3'-5' exoribonuclease
MKKHIFIRDINRENMEVSDYFLVTKKGLLSTKSNSKYITVTLKDSTGTIEGKVWDRADEFTLLFDRHDVVRVAGRSKFYQEKPQLTITDIRKVGEDLSIEEMTQFFPEGGKDIEALRQEFATLVEEMGNPHLAALLKLFSTKPDIFERFCRFPASIGVHHMYPGGLLDHSISMARMGREVARIAAANQDLVVAGCILHDIGKIDELMIRGGFRYSDRGRLLGHISLGIILVENLMAELSNFPPQVADVLTHIIVSHHGTEEWGSPRKPMSVEALMVHYLDNMDAKVMGVREFMKDNMEDDKWSEYHRLYESRFFRLQEG